MQVVKTKRKSEKTENAEKSKNKIQMNMQAKGITLIALIITILFSYDEKLKFSNSKGFLLQTIY